MGRILPPCITCLLSACAIGAGLFLLGSGWAAILLYHSVLLGSLIIGKLTPVQAMLPVLGLVLAGGLWRFAARRLDGLASSIIGHGAGDFAMLLAAILSAK